MQFPSTKTKKVKQEKITLRLPEQESHDLISNENPKASSSNASRLANYLLHNVDNAHPSSDKNAQSEKTVATSVMNEEICERVATSEWTDHEVQDDPNVVDDVYSSDWFELDSKEDLEDFEHF